MSVLELTWKNWGVGVSCRNVWNFAQGLNFKADFHPKMDWGSTPPTPRQFQPWPTYNPVWPEYSVFKVRSITLKYIRIRSDAFVRVHSSGNAMCLRTLVRRTKFRSYMVIYSWQMKSFVRINSVLMICVVRISYCSYGFVRMCPNAFVVCALSYSLNWMLLASHLRALIFSWLSILLALNRYMSCHQYAVSGVSRATWIEKFTSAVDLYKGFVFSL